MTNIYIPVGQNAYWRKLRNLAPVPPENDKKRFKHSIAGPLRRLNMTRQQWKNALQIFKAGFTEDSELMNEYIKYLPHNVMGLVLRVYNETKMYRTTHVKTEAKSNVAARNVNEPKVKAEASRNVARNVNEQPSSSVSKRIARNVNEPSSSVSKRKATAVSRHVVKKGRFLDIDAMQRQIVIIKMNGLHELLCAWVSVVAQRASTEVTEALYQQVKRYSTKWSVRGLLEDYRKHAQSWQLPRLSPAMTYFFKAANYWTGKKQETELAHRRMNGIIDCMIFNSETQCLQNFARRVGSTLVARNWIGVGTTLYCVMCTDVDISIKRSADIRKGSNADRLGLDMGGGIALCPKSSKQREEVSG